MPNFNELLTARDQTSQLLAEHNAALLEAFAELPGQEVAVTGMPYIEVKLVRGSRKSRPFVVEHPVLRPRELAMSGIAQAVSGYPDRLRVDYPKSEDPLFHHLLAYVFKLEGINNLEVQAAVPVVAEV